MPSPRHLLTAVLITSTAIALLGTTADPDLWGHVRFGQDIIHTHSLPSADPYSFTSDRPWINHEWLAEVGMAVAFDTAGTIGLNVFRLATIALTLVFVWLALHGAEPLRRLQFTAIAGLGVLLRVHPVRPQVFSVLLFAVMLWLITRAERRNSFGPLLWIPVVLAAWVNLHGGWIVGLGTFGLWIAGTVLTPRVSSRRRVQLVLIGMVAVLATAINPYGADMWRFLAETVRVDRPMISDWEPTYSLPSGFAALWLVPAAIAAFAVMRAPRQVNRVHTLVVLLLGVAALRVSRLDAFFALATVIFYGPLLSRASEGTDRSPALIDDRLRRLGVATMAVVVAGVGVWQLPRITIPPGNPEPEAARYMREHRLEGRMLTWFDWGEYAIWHLSPRIKVSIDGRRETVYTNRVTTDHFKFYAGAPGFEDYPDRIAADYVWLPRSLPVVERLEAHGWRVVFEGPVSALLTRSDRPEAARVTAPSRRRMFPNL
jgi:hypothetical protein